MAEKATIICFSGDMDKAYAALIIANGAAAMGMQVSMFFMNMSGLGKMMMQIGGVGTYLNEAKDSKINLFI